MSGGPVEIPCTNCGAVNRVAEERLAQGGEVPCAQCFEPITFRPGAAIEGPLAAALDRAFEARRGQPREGLVALEEWAAPETAGDPDEILACPHCRGQLTVRDGRAARKTVLVVESTEFFLRLATEVLGKRYTVVGVRTAAEARRVLATRPVDLVLTDLALPDGDGRDVMTSLPRAGIPVVVLSDRDAAQLHGNAWEELRRLGARDVVQKGLHMEDALAQKVEGLLTS